MKSRFKIAAWDSAKPVSSLHKVPNLRAPCAHSAVSQKHVPNGPGCRGDRTRVTMDFLIFGAPIL